MRRIPVGDVNGVRVEILAMQHDCLVAIVIPKDDALPLVECDAYELRLTRSDARMLALLLEEP